MRERQRERRKDPTEREIDRQRAKAYREAHPEYLIKNKLKKWQAFGGTLELFMRYWQKQRGRCGICGRKLTNPQFDHCHDSLRPRGILCLHCNTKLDWFIRYRKKIKDYLQ